MEKLLIYGMGGVFGGVEKYILDRLAVLNSMYEIYITYPVEEEILYLDKLEKYDIKIIRIHKLLSPWKYYFDLKNIINKYKINVVYCNIGFANYLLYRAVKVNKAKLIVHSHNSVGIDTQNKLKRALLFLYHKVSKYLGVSKIDVKYACSDLAGRWLFGNDEVFTIKKNAIKVKEFQFDETIRESLRAKLKLTNKLVLIHIGRMCSTKNQSFLIEIFAEVLKRHQNAVLLLVGEGEDLVSIQRKAKEFNVYHSVKFLGFRKNISELLQIADIFVLPSLFEGAPIVALEAQASGLNCILSDSITKQIAVTDFVKFLSLDKSPEIWAETILKYISNDKERRNAIGIMQKKGYDLDLELNNYCI